VDGCYRDLILPFCVLSRLFSYSFVCFWRRFSKCVAIVWLCRGCESGSGLFYGTSSLSVWLDGRKPQ